MKINVKIENQIFEVEINDLHARPVLAVVDGVTFEVWPENGAASPAPAAPQAANPALARPAATPAPRPAAALPTASSSKTVQAPLPGVVVSISAQPGQQVTHGQELCVLEAMKMKNAIRAPRAGKIASVLVQIGQHVRHHDPLIEFED